MDVEKAKCGKCGSNRISTKKTFLGFVETHCSQCRNRTQQRLSRNREVLYAFIFVIFSLGIYVHFSETLDRGLITVEDVISPVFAYIFTITTAFALFKNRIFIGRPVSSSQAHAASYTKFLSSLSHNISRYRHGRNILIICIVTLIVLSIALFLRRDTAPQEQIAILDEDVDWHTLEQYERPVDVTFIIKNLTEVEMNGEAVFSLNIQFDKIGKQALEHFASIDWTEEKLNTLFKETDSSDPLAEGFMSFHKRGLRYLNGLNYEPLNVNEPKTEEIHFSIPINVEAKSTQKVTGQVTVPERFKFYHGDISLVGLKEQ